MSINYTSIMSAILKNVDIKNIKLKREEIASFLYDMVIPYISLGEPETYVPGMCQFPYLGGIFVSVGDVESFFGSLTKRSIQSVCKVFAYAYGEEAIPFTNEFSSKLFNQDQFVTKFGVTTLNSPLYNSGALLQAQEFSKFIGEFRRLSKNPLLEPDLDIFNAELATAEKNRQLLKQLVKANLIDQNKVIEQMNRYLMACSVSASPCDVGRAVLNMFKEKGDYIFEPVRKTGLYNTSLDISILVSVLSDGHAQLAAKSGVAGHLPGVFKVGDKLAVVSGCFQPTDDDGNSICGLLAQLVFARLMAEQRFRLLLVSRI